MARRDAVKKSARILALEILRDVEEFDNIPAKAESKLMALVDKEIEEAMKTPEMQKLIKREVTSCLREYVSDYVHNIVDEEGLAKELTYTVVKRILQGK